MPVPTTAVPVVHKTQEPASAPIWSPTEQIDPFAMIVDGLQQRELLTPCLLLSAGYVGMPFFLRQVILLLSPLLALLGLSLHSKEQQLGTP